MAKIDEIYDTIVKSLETATNEELATAYNISVPCGVCQFWHECGNRHDCFDFILEKLEKEK